MVAKMATKSTAATIKQIQDLMTDSDYVPEQLAAYMVPWGDAHQSRFTISSRDQRLAFVTGFTGSAGMAIITKDTCGFWTKVSYHMQAEDELDRDNWNFLKDGKPEEVSQCEWITENCPVGCKIGVDPLFMSYSTWISMSERLSAFKIELVAVTQNLIDVVWEDKPPKSQEALFVYPLKYAGRNWQSKVQQTRKIMRENRAGALVVTALDEIAWLFNLRGADVQYTPVFHAYAIITEHDISLFTDTSRIDVSVQNHLHTAADHGSEKVNIYEYEEFISHLKKLPARVENKLWLRDNANYAAVNVIPQERRLNTLSPILDFKAVKNDAEIAGMRKANIKDSVAFCELLCWLEKEVPNGNVTALSAVTKLQELRRKIEGFRGTSFQVMSCYGLEGAIARQPTEKTDRPVTADELYFIDSGAQFMDGTTDSTRTLHFGTPTAYEKECFTRVLKGHVNLCSLIFPKGVKGHMLDAFTRQSLWEVGLDFDHGNGHGVGAFLYVVDGRYGLSNSMSPEGLVYKEGMIIASEPGYYEDGKFGIRIENCLLVTNADTKYNFKNVGFLQFEVLSLIPLQQKLIDVELLSKKEVRWINKYHKHCRDVIGSELRAQGKEEVYQWLLRHTENIEQA